MRDFQRSIRGWFGMVNNSTPAETRTKTTPPPPAVEEQPIIEKLDMIIEDLEIIIDEISNPTPPNEELKEAVKEYKRKNKNTDEEVQQ